MGLGGRQRPLNGSTRPMPGSPGLWLDESRNRSADPCSTGRWTTKNSRLFRLQAISGELVAVEVTHIGAVGMGVPAAWPDRTLILAAGAESGPVEGRDGCPVGGDKADRPAIGEGRGLTVGRLQHEEFGIRLTPDRAVVT